MVVVGGIFLRFLISLGFNSLTFEKQLKIAPEMETCSSPLLQMGVMLFLLLLFFSSSSFYFAQLLFFVRFVVVCKFVCKKTKKKKHYVIVGQQNKICQQFCCLYFVVLQYNMPALPAYDSHSEYIICEFIYYMYPLQYIYALYCCLHTFAEVHIALSLLCKFCRKLQHFPYEMYTLSLTCTHTHCTVSFPLLLFYSRGCFWLPHSHTFIRHSSHTVCHMISALGLAMMLMMSDATLFNKYSYSVVKYVNKQNKSYFFSILSLTVV